MNTSNLAAAIGLLAFGFASPALSQYGQSRAKSEFMLADAKRT